MQTRSRAGEASRFDDRSERSQRIDVETHAANYDRTAAEALPLRTNLDQKV